MKSFRIRKILVLIALGILLISITGCAFDKKTVSLDNSEKKLNENKDFIENKGFNKNKSDIIGENKISAGNSETAKDTKDTNSEGKTSKALSDTNSGSKDDAKAVQKGESLIKSGLDKQKESTKAGEFAKYSNSKRSWWFKKQEGNKPSKVNAEIENMLKKYNGIYIHHTQEKVLYLTFDEGYENGYTPKILDVLKANNVKAAFFITGPYLKAHSKLVKRMLDEGHIVGNHTVNHPGMPDIKDDKKLEEEILGLERSFNEMFGKNMKYLRPPKGEYSERTLALTESLGYKTVFWSFAYADWDVNNQKGEDYAYKAVMNGIHNGAVLLLHAVSNDNANALEKIIKDAKEKGYVFKSLNDLFQK